MLFMRNAVVTNIANPEAAMLDEAAPKAAIAQRIRLANYPMLPDVAWSTDPEAELTPSEGFALHERNWRHIDRQSMSRHERDLVTLLIKTIGKSVLLV